METLKNIFMLVGICVTGFCALLLLTAIGDAIIDAINHAKWEYKFKHRFDKPPLAKCYCKDCKYRMKKLDECTVHGSFCAIENYFCADAEPKEKEEIL